jgi:hypothetical protein
VESALAALHGRGLPHGAVDSDHVLVGPGRALLLLPGAAGAGALAQSGQHADRRQDQDALARLFEARK